MSTVFDTRINTSNFWTYIRPSTWPFWMIHLAAVMVVFFDFSWEWVVLAIGSYYFRMFFITGGYHRYFAHRTYSTSRAFQFVLAFIAQTSAQKGALWWAAHHRDHHRYSDTPLDVHSPKKGFLWSHMGWILSERHERTLYENIPDLARFPELRFINKHYWVCSTLYAVLLWACFGWVGFFWGFCFSTVLLWHGTFTINSLSHIWGTRRFETSDTSRNNFILALVTLGEGWHNNHHKFAGVARNGFYWWEIDITYYVLKMLSWLGLVWNLSPLPKKLLK